jgi:hypothetical protein
VSKHVHGGRGEGGWGDVRMKGGEVRCVLEPTSSLVEMAESSWGLRFTLYL